MWNLFKQKPQDQIDNFLPTVIVQDKLFNDIYRQVDPYSMTSMQRMYALYQAVQYIFKNKITGDFVECGVWKGGSTMMMAYALKSLKDVNRQIYLYDTYQGMARPEVGDYRLVDKKIKAQTIWQKNQRRDYNRWCYSPLGEVKRNLYSTGYPKESLCFIKGKVEETIPKIVPGKIAVLRLDTDWYKSTKHELIHLYPRLSRGGVLIIDDYGYWSGSKKAVDEYFKKKSILLNFVDEAAVIGIKI